MDINNEAQMKKFLEAVATSAIKNVSKKLLEKLRASIEKYVYRYDTSRRSNSLYAYGNGKPTYQFLYTWKWDDIESLSDSIVRELFYDWQTMDVNEHEWVHGSFAGDARESLADILNNPYKGDGSRTSSLFVGNDYFSKKRGPYWDKFIDEIYGNKGSIGAMFDEELAKFGFSR